MTKQEIRDKLKASGYACEHCGQKHDTLKKLREHNHDHIRNDGIVAVKVD